MKTLITFLLTLLFPFITVNAQDTAAYAKAMQGALAQMQTAATAEQHTAAINTFSRISEAMPQEWLPGYYRNFTRLNMLDEAAEVAAKDKLLEEVLLDIERMLQQHPGNSELLTLKGYHHMLFVAADPASRGAQFSGQTLQVLQQAIAANPDNPRAHLLLGQMQLGIAQFMGSPATEACKSINRAHALFGEQVAAQSIQPQWGAAMAAQLLQHCSSQE